LKYVVITIEHFSQRRPDIRFVSPNALSYGSLDGKSVNLLVIEELLSKTRNIIGEAGKIYFGSFPNELRPETITEESVALLKKYTNAKKVIVGGQSGSNRILHHTDRGHDSQETERAVKLLTDAGFSVDVDIIFGLPKEEYEDVEATMQHIQTLVQIGATIHSHTFMPLVGTPFAGLTPGTIHPKYKRQIERLQSSGNLSGFHVKQEREAKKMADRRKKNMK
jgi:radical SAM superfamily enzyme YgiQ (UPF0313 family)